MSYVPAITTYILICLAISAMSYLSQSCTSDWLMKYPSALCVTCNIFVYNVYQDCWLKYGCKPTLWLFFSFYHIQRVNPGPVTYTYTHTWSEWSISTPGTSLKISTAYNVLSSHDSCHMICCIVRHNVWLLSVLNSLQNELFYVRCVVLTAWLCVCRYSGKLYIRGYTRNLDFLSYKGEW